MKRRTQPSARYPAGSWIPFILAACLVWSAWPLKPAEPLQQAPAGAEIPLVVGRSIVLDHPDEIQRVAINDPAIADAIAISTQEILINAKGVGVTTLVVWSRAGERNFFTITVSADVEQIQDHLRAAFPGENVRIIATKGVVTLTGQVSSESVAERILAMATGYGGGTVVSNLEIPPPPPDRQILLRVKFAEVQRSAMNEFGATLMSTGALNTPGSTTTQQFGSARPGSVSGTIGAPVTGTASSFSLTDTLNVFAFRPDINIGAIIKALQSRQLSEVLAEPNVIATSGKEADLLVGGEFPVPVLQGGATAGAVTIQFREFGIRITFLPVITPRGTIQMHVRPEVSALDFANAVTLQGFLIPALSTRRVETDVELRPGQSFVIGGLIDNRIQETVNRIPGLASIPLLGNIFRSHSRSKDNAELLVLVTPEFPTAYEPGEEQPDIDMPRKDFFEPLVTGVKTGQ